MTELTVANERKFVSMLEVLSPPVPLNQTLSKLLTLINPHCCPNHSYYTVIAFILHLQLLALNKNIATDYRFYANAQLSLF